MNGRGPTTLRITMVTNHVSVTWDDRLQVPSRKLTWLAGKSLGDIYIDSTGWFSHCHVSFLGCNTRFTSRSDLVTLGRSSPGILAPQISVKHPEGGMNLPMMSGIFKSTPLKMLPWKRKHLCLYYKPSVFGFKMLIFGGVDSFCHPTIQEDHNKVSTTLQETNISHHGKRKIIFKSALGWDMNLLGCDFANKHEIIQIIPNKSSFILKLLHSQYP